MQPDLASPGLRMALLAAAIVGSVAVGHTDVLAGEGTPMATAGASNGIDPGTGPNAIVAPVMPTVPLVAAKTLFGAARTPAPLAARAIGFYSKGCLAGGQKMPVDGPEWQAMRLSRNRNWGHPTLVALLERFAGETHRSDGWPGLLVGDMSQPRGGPMLTGHASHQIGLDADIWFTPMPPHRMTNAERENNSAVTMLAPGNLSVDRKVWSVGQLQLVKRAASYPEVERIFVHPAIKKAICEATVQDTDKAWLHKVRPMYGHDYHFHIRIHCPAGMDGCQHQEPPPVDDGCGKELAEWFARLTAPPKPRDPSVPPEPPTPPLTLDNLPTDCRQVLSAAPTTSPNWSTTATVQQNKASEK